MDRVDIGESSVLVIQTNHGVDVVDRTRGIEGIADCDQLGSAAHLLRQIGQVESCNRMD